MKASSLRVVSELEPWSCREWGGGGHSLRQSAKPAIRSAGPWVIHPLAVAAA